MIPEVVPGLNRPAINAPPLPAWQQALRDAFSSPTKLLEHLGVNPHDVSGDVALDREFVMRVPASFVQRMRPGDPQDPLLLQVLPRRLEAQQTDGFSTDPVGDRSAVKRPGLLHKYAGRVLVVTTGACAVHCRYCFRQHFPYHEARAWEHNWSSVLEYVRADSSIHEVILSGGDPLMLSDKRLSELIALLAEIGHLRRLRIHSRMPIVIPQRIDTALCSWLARLPLTKVMVLHANHGNEINAEIAQAVDELKAAGVTVLNQSVLLRGINDSLLALGELSERLFAAGILPYYLHRLDPVEGAGHFEVGLADTLRLLDSLRTALPGYLVPRLVEERAGEAYKLPIERLGDD